MKRSNTKKTKNASKDLVVNTQLYTNGSFMSVFEKCDGCERVITINDVQYCRTFADPPAKWKIGICNFATHVKPEIVTAKVKINPLKAAKRASRKT